MSDKQARERFFSEWEDQYFTEDQSIYKLFTDITAGFVRGDVLDLGCGSRIYYDTSAVDKWVGVDLSPILLDGIQFLGGKAPTGAIETVQGNCEILEFDDESFDFVCCIFLLHHMGRNNKAQSRAVVQKVIGQSMRVLKPGGSMIVMESWPHIVLQIYGWVFPLLYPVVRRMFNTELPLFWSAKELKQMAVDAGYDQQHVLSIPLYETAKYPVSGIVMPGWMQRIIHKYGYYVFKKSSKRSD